MATIAGGQVKLNNGTVVAPQQGAWYDGRQYWGGTLSDPGVINKLSDQVGAGQLVSKEVNLQSDAAQGLNPGDIEKYLATQRTVVANAPAPTMTSTKQVQNYTNGVQNGAAAAYKDPNAPKVQSIADITTELKNQLPTDEPTAPKLLDTYNQMTADGTVTALEKSIIDLKAQREDALAQLRVNTAAERSKPVATNVIEGRVSQQQRAAQETVDFINRQLQTASDELTMRYKSIETIMKYTQLDFENAKSVYDTKFNQTMTLMTQARGIQQDQLTAEQRAIDNARANLQIYANAITAGNLNVSNLPPEAAASLNAMELAAGLPMGFVQNLKMSPKDQIAHINDRTGEVYGFDGNGGLKVIGNVGASAAGSASGTGVESYTPKQWQEKVSSAINIIKDVDTSYQTIGGKAISGTKKDEFGTVLYDTKNQGDQLLSIPEMQIARQQIINSVGGNEEVGKKLFNDAMNGGKYNVWQP